MSSLLVVCLGVLAPEPGGAVESEVEPADTGVVEGGVEGGVELRVELVELEPEQGARLEAALLRGAAALMSTEEFEVDGDTLELQVSLLDPEVRLYRVSLDVIGEGELRSSAAKMCPACSAQQLLEQSLGLMIEAASAGASPPEEEAGEDCEERLAGRESPRGALGEPPDEGATGSQIGGLGIAGVGLLSAGAVAIGTGLVLYRIDDVFLTREFSDPTPRTSGLVSIVAGSAGVLLGVSGLLVDQLLRARRGRQERLQIGAAVSPGFAGIRARGRF